MDQKARRRLVVARIKNWEKIFSWFPDQFFLTGFAFVHRDDLQIVAGRFQHQRFVHFAR
jgi:hypothetical protein